ncbi:GIY-YIG nuclease family protein [Neisseria zalophi]|uniref:GIY-YIG nuclease family protein n=1 Tax=Neisseria zalophi TaxID=640030 RepID=A0A5J6PWY1_9NEIS|nr:GIY-YIG nuclease family protein [Neisseria zalophi]QEY26794.1 GIY-YIG nuclease family protein [Neisseria zalophi]
MVLAEASTILNGLPHDEGGDWCVYLILCDNGSFYCGISNRPQARFAAHQAGKGAKYTRMHKPLLMRLVCTDISYRMALRAENQVKKLKAEQKRMLWASLIDFQTA